MKSIISRLIIAAILLGFGASVQAARIVQIWNCTLQDGQTYEDAAAVSSAWAKAANGVAGGENFEVILNFPLAADADEGDFSFVLVAPNATAWGTFEDVYEGSAAQEADESFGEVATCDTSQIWRSVKM